MKTRDGTKGRFGAGARIALAQDELLLILLGLLPGKPVNGWGVLERELRLLAGRLAEAGVEASVPDSETLRVLVDLLEMEGFIEVRNRRTPTSTKFKLRFKGMVEAEKLLRKLRKNFGKRFVEKLKTARIGWDQLGHEGMKRYVETISRSRTVYEIEYILVSPEGKIIRQKSGTCFESYEEAERHAEEYAETLREQGFKVSYNITKTGVLL